MTTRKTGKSKKPAKTEAPTSDAALRDAHWRLESIIEGTHVGTWEWNVQAGETVFNEVWAQIVGYTLEELAPISIRTWEALAHPGHAPPPTSHGDPRRIRPAHRPPHQQRLRPRD